MTGRRSRAGPALASRVVTGRRRPAGPATASRPSTATVAATRIATTAIATVQTADALLANVVAKVVDLESNSLLWHPALFAPQELVHVQDTIRNARHGDSGDGWLSYALDVCNTSMLSYLGVMPRDGMLPAML